MKWYSKEVKDFIVENVKGKTAKELAELVNARFETAFTAMKMKGYKANHKLKSDTVQGIRAGASRLCAPEVQQFIRKNTLGKTTKELTEQTNKTFGTAYSEGQMKAYKTNHGLRNGLNFQFQKGHEPPNKGVKGIHNSPETEFGKGNIPPNYCSIGTEILRPDGYIWTKIADPNKWKQNHRLIWEAENGSVPSGHVLIFKDSNHQNVTLDNLTLITRKELLILNQKGLIYPDPKSTETGVNIAKVLSAAYSAGKGNRK